MFHSNFAAALLLGLTVFACSAAAQLPTSQLESVFPAGAAPDATLEVTIAGSNLDETDTLLFSHGGIKATAKMAEATPFDESPLPVENVFSVSVASNVPPGRYEVRSQGKYGLSNPRSFVVGTLTEVVEVEPNGGNDVPAWSEVDDGAGGTTPANPATELTVPATANGQLNSAADVDWYRFKGTGGTRLMLNGYAKRIDSPMEMIVTLHRANGSLVAESRSGPGGDPLLDATLPADEEFFVKVHDALYRNGSAYFYRLEVASVPHLEFIWPPAGSPGSNQQYTLYGSNLPGGAKSNWSVDGVPLEMLKVQIPIPADAANKLQYSCLLGPHQGGMDGIEYRFAQGNLRSNPLLITAATAPAVEEAANNDLPTAAQKLSPPCEVMGQFYPVRDVDWYSFEATKDDVWALDLYSQRLGFSTDASLLIQRVSVDEEGQEQVSDVRFIDDVQEPNFNNQSGRHEFDYRTTDPSYLFTAPADGTYRVLVKEGHSAVKTDPRLIYRLAIRKPAQDFRIVAVPGMSTGSLLLRRGGRQVVHVFAVRRDGYDGEIRVSASGLPPGVTADEIVIGPANTMGTLILTTAGNAPPTTSALQVTAKATVDGREVVRPARYGAALEAFQFAQPNAVVASVPARIVDGIQLCVTDYEPLPLLMTIGAGQPLETSRGGVLKIPYQVQRADGASGNLSGFVIDFPPQTNAPQVNIGANTQGEFELRFQAATPPGTYTIYLAGFNQGYSYRRNPELAESAVKRQERIAGILTEAQQSMQKAQENVNAKQTELQAATNAANQAKTANQQAAQAVSAAEAALKKAEEAKLQADMELQAAREFQQRAQQEKQRADQFANQKKNEANPRNININVPSNSLTIKVTDFPIKVDALAEAFTVKQGEKIEVPLSISRLYDFKAGVNVQTQPPGGVGGIAFQNVTVPENQATGKFEINASPNATPGEHACTVRLTMNFNGQNLTMERPLKLTVIQ